MKQEITVGGASSHEGVLFYSDNYEIRIKTFPNIEVGDIKPINMTNDYEIMAVPAILVIFTIIELLGKAPLHIWYIFRPIIVIFFIVTFIFLYKYHGIESFNHLRMNHGAEHKVIDAYRNRNIDNIENTNRILKGCGSNIMVPILVMISLGDWISYPFTLSLIYYVAYMYVKPVRNILFKVIGKPVQYLTTKEPTPDIIDAVKIGFFKLIEQEEKENDKYETE